MKYKKILINFILIMIILSTTAFGTLIGEFEKSIHVTGAEDLENEGGKIVGLIQVVGTIVSIGMIGILGIRYVLGSAEERAEYKKTLIPYFVGAVLIFGASNLTQIIYEWAKEI